MRVPEASGILSGRGMVSTRARSWVSPGGLEQKSEGDVVFRRVLSVALSAAKEPVLGGAVVGNASS